MTEPEYRLAAETFSADGRHRAVALRPMSEYTDRIEEVARRIDGAKEYL
jgi:hypothetical protein